MDKLNQKEKEDRLKEKAVLMSKRNQRLKNIEEHIKMLEKDIKSQLSAFRIKVINLLDSE